MPVGRLDLLGLFRDGFVGQRRQPFLDHFGVYRILGQPGVEIRLKPKNFGGTNFEALHIPLFGIGARRAGCADQIVHRLMAHVDHDVIDGVAVHDVAALFIDDLALIVHHVIIFDDLLADIIVAGLDLALRRLDRLAQPFGRRQCLAIFQVRPDHLGEHRVRAEDAHQIVVEAEVEARQAGVALAARTTA